MKTNYYFILLLLFVTLATQAQIVRKEFYVPKAGTLITQLTENEANETTHLNLTGNINAQDFKHLRNEFIQLQVIDLSEVNIRAYTGKDATHPDKFYVYMAGNIPPYAFCRKENDSLYGKKTLKKIILPSNVRNIEDNAFQDCTSLEICVINKATPPHLQKGALNDTLTAIFIPQNSSDKYRQKPRWEEFVFIENEPSSVYIDIPEGSSLEMELQKMAIQPKDINFFALSGNLGENDFKLIRDYMPNLVSIDMENTNATMIPPFTFSHKKYLLRATLPKQLEVIGERSFSNCNRLSGDIILPKSLTAINYGAFMGCDRLNSLKATGNNLNALGDKIFGEQPSKLKY